VTARLTQLGGQPEVEAYGMDDMSGAWQELAFSDPKTARVTPMFAQASWPTFACDRICIAAWTPYGETVLHASLRDHTGWTHDVLLGDAFSVRAAATFGDLVLVAWAEYDAAANQCSIELRQLDGAGDIVSSSTLAHDAGCGYLALTASPIGAVVAWEGVAPSGSSIATVTAQLLAPDGTLDGDALAIDVANAALDDDQPAPAAFIGAKYRVAHTGLGADTPWLAVDPAARTIVPETIGTLPGAIQSIVPVADGAALAIALDSGNKGVVVHVTGTTIAQTLMVPAVPALWSGDAVSLAYAFDGSIYTATIPSTFDGLSDPVEIAKPYDVSSCSAGGSATGGGAIALVLASLLPWRRARTRRDLIDPQARLRPRSRAPDGAPHRDPRA
jgi:hypothetical protein